MYDLVGGGVAGLDLGLLLLEVFEFNFEFN